jgi:hypothetical protein
MNAHTGSSIASVETLLGQVADEYMMEIVIDFSSVSIPFDAP